MIGWILLGLFVGITVVLAFYTWLDRFIVPMERWSALAYVAGAALGGLGMFSVISIAAGW